MEKGLARFAGWLMLLVAAVSTAAPAAASAAAAEDTPIPRIYFDSGTPRADPAKPADIAARETALADAADAACKPAFSPVIWDACIALARAYHYGKGRPQNRPVAELLLRKACDADQGDGCYALAALLADNRTENDLAVADTLYARACRLGSLNGCFEEADSPADPQAAEPRHRAICARGGNRSCRALASLLMGEGRSDAEWEEGRALRNRLCGEGDATACREAANYWHQFTGEYEAGWLAYYRQAGCGAGEASLCSDGGWAALQQTYAPGPAERERALAWFDEACRIDYTACTEATDLRAMPQLETRCTAGDAAACLSLGRLLADQARVVQNRPRALELLGAHCLAAPAAQTSAEPGAEPGAVCAEAGLLAIELANDTGVDRSDQIATYLTRGCSAGAGPACTILAEQLTQGQWLMQDLPRAATLYIAGCELADSAACKALDETVALDPATPLMLAHAGYGPELTPEEAAEEERLRKEEEAREAAAADAKRCTTTTVQFEGQSYTDRICQPREYRIYRGYSVQPGTTPWQALIWRPEKHGDLALPLADRVHCGGTVIETGWVLTAAHCLNDKYMGGVAIKSAGHRIRLGLVNALGDEGLFFPIINTFRHPDYKPSNLGFDIALVQYDHQRGTRGSSARRPVHIRIDDIRLEQRKLENLARVATYGWGTMSVARSQIPDQLRGARVKLRDLESCTQATGFLDRARRNHVICADALSGKDGGQACFGDSGGPLISYSEPDKKPTLIGVVSGGKDCGIAGEPSRFIRVAHPKVRSWLNRYLPLIWRR